MSHSCNGTLFLAGITLLAWAGLVVHCYPGDPIATSALWALGVPGLVLAIASWSRLPSRGEGEGEGEGDTEVRS